MNDLDSVAALVVAAQDNYGVADDVVWMQVTAARIRTRYGLALRGLAEVPELFGDLGRFQVPETAGTAALALEDVISGVIDQLEGIGEYLRAVADPGPAYCTTCRLGVAIFHGSDDWQHYEIGPADAPFLERRQTIVQAEHAPVVSWDRPERPAWPDIEGDVTEVTR